MITFQYCGRQPEMGMQFKQTEEIYGEIIFAYEKTQHKR
jgi:hypothetical protein